MFSELKPIRPVVLKLESLSYYYGNPESNLPGAEEEVNSMKNLIENNQEVMLEPKTYLKTEATKQSSW